MMHQNQNTQDPAVNPKSGAKPIPTNKTAFQVMRVSNAREDGYFWRANLPAHQYQYLISHRAQSKREQHNASWFSGARGHYNPDYGRPRSRNAPWHQQQNTAQRHRQEWRQRP